MKVKIIGVRRVQGIKPNTDNYRDGYVVHCIYHDGDVIGDAVISLWVRASIYQYEMIKIGDTYEVSIKNNYVCSLSHAN